MDLDVNRLEKFIEDRQIELDSFKHALEVARRVLPEHLKVELIREQHDRLEEQIKNKDGLLTQLNEKIRAAQRQAKELDGQVSDKTRELKRVEGELNKFRQSILSAEA